MKKVLLCVQLSPHDVTLGKSLLRLYADLRGNKCEVADLLIAYRFDVPRDNELELYCARRFNVWTHTTRRRVVNWPAGCNAMFADIYTFFVEKNRAHKDGWDYDYLFLTEADCLPTRLTWLEEIVQETYASGKMVNGSWFEADDYGCKHINGNCLLHRDFWRKNRDIFTPPGRIGWDAKFGPAMQRDGHASRLIMSCYRWGMPENPYTGPEQIWEPKRYPGPSNPLYGQDIYPALVHGAKLEIIQQDVRKKLLTAAT
jgi:hypothetical protein